jgi:hypothetical protein
VTSPTGAVIRDIIHRLTDRFPREVLVWPVRVQGDGSAEEVAAAIRGFNAIAEDDDNLPRPDIEALAQAKQHAAEMQVEHEMQQEQLATLQAQLPQADEARRAARLAAQDLERQLGHTEARLNALKQLQAQLDNDQELHAWLRARGTVPRAQAAFARITAAIRALAEGTLPIAPGAA